MVGTAQRVLRRYLIRQAVDRTADKWKNLPNGWTQKSLKSFWSSLTGKAKHKVTSCISKMDGKVDDPGAFCASLADRMEKGWRSR
jgi:hypothetical protein